MSSATYHGNGVDVVRQSGQFDCYRFGSQISLGLATLSDIDDLSLSVRSIAQNLVDGVEPPALVTTSIDPRVDYYGLYTFGVYGDAIESAMTPAPADTLLAPYCTSDLPLSVKLLINFARFGNSVNATAYFSDFPHCTL